MTVYFAKVRRVLVEILILNWGVAVMKLACGLITNCASMTADGAHSFSDGASNLIGLLGVWIAAKPVDKNHPYGHKKYETFAALGIAFLLLMVALGVIHESISRLVKHAVPTVNLISFSVMIITMLVNVFVIIYEQKKGRKLGSDFLIADAAHTKSDIFVSSGVMVALLSSKLGYPIIDPICAFVIAGFIAKAGFEIVKQSSSVLCDTAPLAAEEVRGIVSGIKGIKECHEIRTRGRADDIHIDLHLIVDPDMHVDDAHALAHSVEHKIKKLVKGVTDVVVHIEPTSAKSK